MTKYKMELSYYQGENVTYNVYRCGCNLDWCRLFDFTFLKTLTNDEKIEELKNHLKNLEPLYFDA